MHHSRGNNISVVQFLSKLLHLREMARCCCIIQSIKGHFPHHLMGISKKLLSRLHELASVRSKRGVQLRYKFPDMLLKGRGGVSEPRQPGEFHHITPRSKEHLKKGVICLSYGWRFYVSFGDAAPNRF